MLGPNLSLQTRIRNKLLFLWNIHILLIILAVAFGVSVVSAFLNQESSITQWLSAFLQNVGSDVLGAGIAFVLIDIIAGTRKLKRQYYIALGSPDNATAVNAVSEMYINGWLHDGTLQKSQGYSVNFDPTRDQPANLRNVRLKGIDLRSLHFFAELQGADLRGTSFENANISYCKFDQTTLLPDGSNWTPETDMTRFTDRNHPDFWEPDWVKERREQQ